MSNTTGCQLSIINYSGYVDGQPAVIFSNPAATKRANGTIRVGLISENGFYDNGEPIYRITWKYARIIMPDEFATLIWQNSKMGILPSFMKTVIRAINYSI